MNTNRINNKNLKRIAIAAGTTAAALFLSAGLVACDAKSSDTVAQPTSPAELVEILENAAADITPTVDMAAAIEDELAPVAETETKSTSKPATKSTKSSKQKSSAVGGSVILDVPTVGESGPAVETTIAPAPQQADNAAATTPVEQPVASEPVAASAPAPASNTGTTAISVPKITSTDSISSTVKGIDLTKAISTISVPQICIPGYNC